MIGRVRLQIGSVIQFDRFVDCLSGVLVGVCHGREHFAEGDAVGFAPMIRLPEIGSDERLRAMKETLIDSYAGGEDGRPTPGGQSIEEFRIASEFCATIDSKGLRRTWNHEDQADVRIFENVEMPFLINLELEFNA